MPITTTFTLIIPDRISRKPNLIIVLLRIVLKKIATKTPSHGTHFEIVLKNHALRAQPTDYIVVSYLLADSCSLSVGCADFKNNCRLLANETTDSECNV